MLNGLGMNSLAKEPSRRRRMPWRSTLALLACGFLLWLIHPPLLSEGLRFALREAAARVGLLLEVGKIEAEFGHPIVLRGVKIRAQNAENSRTAADVERIEMSLNWPWRVFVRDGRLIRELIVENARAVIDLRVNPRLQNRELFVAAGLQQQGQPKTILQLLPEYIEVHRANLEFVALHQSYYFEDVSADLSEHRPGTFNAAGAEFRVRSFHQSVGSLKGITAWKDGILYLSGLHLWEGVEIDLFTAELARPGGAALGMEATLHGGSLRADISFNSGKDSVAIDSAVWGSQIDVAPLAALLGFNGKAEGVIREVRFTFRGSPERALEGEASLRLAADEFRWNKRGWESLSVGASMIHRRVAISDFELKQKENMLTGNGEFSLDEGWLGIAKAPFILNVTASIKDLAALAGLFGSPFDEMTGRMSLSGSISGQSGKLGGFMSLEASGMAFRNHPIDSGRLDVSFSNTEGHINRCEFWSGQDFLHATGTLDVLPPYTYSGEVRVQTQDVSKYRDFYRSKDFSTIRRGAARIRWQGDGTASAHSGAFQVSLDNVVSEYTPTGLTGRFAGTYSPENVYFNGFELAHERLRFSTRATLARTGITLNDTVLSSPERKLADAEVYLPVDPFGLASGRSPKEAIHLDKNLYASIVSREPLSIRELLSLIGNDHPVDGTVELDLNLEGVPSALTFNGKLQGVGIKRRFEDGAGPAAQFTATFQGTEGFATCTGELASSGLSPIKFDAKSRFSIVRAADGTLRWMDPEGDLSATMEIPKIDLAIFRPLLPRIGRMGGLLSGKLALTGTVGKPLLQGELTISDGRLEISAMTPVIASVNGALTFNAARATVETFSGEMGKGSFELRGGASLENLSDPYYELFFYGRNVDLARIVGLQLSANVNLYASGDSAAGMLKGTIRLLDGRLSRKLEITPLLAAPTGEDKLFSAPQFSGIVPAPLKNWKIDLSMSNDTPFLISGNAASGEIIPELQLTGTLSNPMLLGQVQLKNMRVFLPVTAMTVPEGYLHFVEDSPWMPLLDIRGTAQALDYEVQAYAFGPLSERRLILRSDPPLPQDSLIHLLTTGIAPSVYVGTRPVETLEPLRNDGRQFRSKRSGKIGHVNQRNTTPLTPPGGRSTLRGRFELWRGLALINESDAFGLSERPAYFSLRLR
jgi:hypothetical protein